MALTNAESNVVEIKEPKAVIDNIDHGFIWTDWLIGADEVFTSTWELFEADGVTNTTDLVITQERNDGINTIVWLSEGVAGKTYIVANTIVTTDTRRKELRFMLPVIN